MYIAIVDREKIGRETAEVYLKTYIRENWLAYEPNIHIEVFYCGADFLKFFKPKIYQLVILGAWEVRIAKIIRARDRDVKIVFLKSFDENGEKIL